MEITHIEHIGIAVKNMEEAIKYYEGVLGFKCYLVEEVRTQKTKTAFFMVGQTKIELLESTDQLGPIGRFIEAKGEGIHHIAFAVNNLQDSLKEVATKGVQLIDTEPKRGSDNLNIAFLHPKSTRGVLTELCEKIEK
ncbi:MAG: methylmalonyl-CoA epimerase [Melioribacteraceae bacterium]